MEHAWNEHVGMILDSEHISWLNIIYRAHYKESGMSGKTFVWLILNSSTCKCLANGEEVLRDTFTYIDLNTY